MNFPTICLRFIVACIGICNSSPYLFTRAVSHVCILKLTQLQCSEVYIVFERVICNDIPPKSNTNLFLQKKIVTIVLIFNNNDIVYFNGHSMLV